MTKASTSQPRVSNFNLGDEDRNMNAFRDEIARGLFSRQ